MLPGNYDNRLFPRIRGQIRWGTLFFLALVTIGQSAALAQDNAPPAPPAQALVEVCTQETFARRVTAYLIQRCFDENRLLELRRAIQRRQFQLENDNQQAAEELMAMLGINRSVLNSLLLLMSETDVNVENQAEFLAESVMSFRALARDLELLNAADREGQVFADISAEINRGDWTAASKLALVMETRALAEKRQNGSDKSRSAREAIAEFMLGQIALVRGSYPTAARHFEVAAVYAERSTDEGQAFSEAAADALYADAKRNWNEQSLQEAIDIYRRVLDLRPRSSSAELWARTQNKLGTAILRLGVGTNSVPLITGAVSAFEAALEVQTQSSNPDGWAVTTANLADALVQLANSVDEQDDLLAALDAYRKVLAQARFEDEPGRWVELQTSLGNALWSLGRRETGPEALIEAIATFQEALKGLRRDRQLRDWGATHNNIGAAYFLLAERVAPVDNARNAVAAFEESLSAYQEASAVYFITGVRKNLAGAQALLQQSEAQQAPDAEVAAPGAGTSSQTSAQ
jgi:tetratricopeptide (TPR) repeat protein